MIRFFAGLTAVVILWAGFVVPGRAETVTLRVAHPLDAWSSIHAGFLVPWAGAIRTASGGRLEIALDPMSREPDLAAAVAAGRVDMAWFPVSATPGRFRRAEVVELPLLAGNAEITTRGLWSGPEGRLLADFEGLTPLALHVQGYGVLHAAGAPPIRPEDLAGRRVGVPTEGAAALFRALGAQASVARGPDAAAAMAAGRLDAVVASWEEARAARIHEVATGHTEFPAGQNLATRVFVLAAAPARFAALPEDLRRVLLDASGAGPSLEAAKAMDAYDIPGRAVADNRGNRIVTLSPVEAQRWRDAAAPVLSRWAAAMEAAGLPGATLLAETTAALRRAAGL